MKLIFTTLFTILAFCFIGCQTNNFYPYTNEKSVPFSLPKLDEIRTIGLGEELLVQGIATTSMAIELLNNELNGQIPKGLYFLDGKKHVVIRESAGEVGAFSFDNNKKIIKEEYDIYRFGYGSLKRTWLNYTYPAWLEYNTKTEELKLVCPALGNDKIKTFNYLEKAKVESAANFQQTLLYLGKSGNLLKFAYRESSFGLVRDSFSTEIAYDLNDSNVIGYKNAKIQIINATNTSITYKVLSYFSEIDNFVDATNMVENL